ncbi:MAG: 2-oxoacid:ferredoxin oxidoreductase subunit beta [Methanobacteriota archaeon]|nr:MAG: 2-oxoacid:ferredoxin oxidoreductase subunit beta [Euryarchaeota archaeon]
MDLDTPVENTWCPGCGDFGLLNAFKRAVSELVEEGFCKKEDLVVSSGIGCHGKIVDYLHLNSFYSIHGRAITTISGMKLANPNLQVVAFQGDGDALAEGIGHIVHVAKRNINTTMIVHNNEVYSLTTGQFTPTSKKGFKGKSTPKGNVEEPMNPAMLALASGGTFVARGFVGKIDHLKGIFKEAIKHEGFSFVEVMQPCVTFLNTFKLWKEMTYILENHDPSDFDAAWEKAKETEKLPIGILYQSKAPTYEKELLGTLIPAQKKGAPLEEIKAIFSER